MNRFLRTLIYLLIVMVPFGPRIAMSIGNIYTTTIFLSFIMLLWLVKKVVDPRFMYSSLSGTVFVFLGGATIYFLLNLPFLIDNMVEGLRAFQFLLFISVFFVVDDVFREKKYIQKAIKIFFLVSIAEVVVAILYLKVGMPLVDRYYTLGSEFFPHQMVGTFMGEHNAFASYILFPLLLLLAIFPSVDHRKKLLMLPLFLLYFYALFFSFSRSGYIGIFAGGLSLIFFDRINIRLLKRSLVFILVVFALYYAINTMPVFDVVKQRAYSIYQIFTAEIYSISWEKRLEMWQSGVSNTLSSPLLAMFGSGFFSTRLSDNFFINFFCETGFVGFFMYLYLIGGIIRAIYRRRRVHTNGFVRAVLKGMLAIAIVELIVLNLSGDNFKRYMVMANFWILLPLFMNIKEEKALQNNEFCQGEVS